jgi:hypothetical protein
MRTKNVNRPDLLKGFVRNVETGTQLFGAIKGAWDIGKTVMGAVRVAAPYVARIAAVI